MSQAVIKGKFQLKKTLIVLLGTLLEYYDFLLFAHLGFIITPLFFSVNNPVHSHILSLLLLGISFVVRPIGGLIFGNYSDKYGRKSALVKSITWIVFPAIGFAFLPDYNSIGVTASYLFIILRLIQGIAIGGEYPVAGTYLMEMHKSNQGFISSLLVAVGSVGSIIGLGFAMLCTLPESPTWLWRVGFLLGGFASLVSYYIRKNFRENTVFTKAVEVENTKNINSKRFLILVSGLLIGVTVWLPMTYSNFYVTKILGLDVKEGLYASFIALIFYILMVPFVGMYYDRVNTRRYILSAILLIGPIDLFSFYQLTKGNIFIGQFGLVLAASLFGAPIHKLMNNLFPVALRGRNIGFLLMLGLSFGGLIPSISGYLVSETRVDLIPAILVVIISYIVFWIFYKYYNREN